MDPERFNCSRRGGRLSLHLLFLASALALAAGSVHAQSSTAAISIAADQPGVAIASNQFGIFFEEISFAGEGGLYAEMVRNRTLGNSANPDYWTLVTQGTAAGQLSVDTTQPLNSNILQSLKLTFASGTGSVGAANNGFWGMSLQSGATYYLSFYASAAAGFTGPLTVRLQSANGLSVYAQASFVGLTTTWQRFTATLVSSTTDTNAQLVASIAQPATVWLDVVSLFPRATFNNRTNGIRADLAAMLAANGPSFMRFPGGNYIEGNHLTNAVRWKKGIGDIAQRPGHMNDAWGYWSTDGLGYHEFLQLCEDLGCEPLFGINCGLSLGYNGNPDNTVPLNQMGPWVQDALDAIQYANGDTSTTWGAQRAANGHPAPFNLKYIEIGNENGGNYYNDRYALFYDAITSNYPAMHIIANVWGGIPSSRPVLLQDEHYYSSPATFISYATKYDTYSRAGPRVFVGEYAVTSGYGTLGNLVSALAEASFMTGMERNSDIVLMASYAPLFQNVNFNNWRPDLIYYDNTRACGTPSYYVQRLFSRNLGDQVLPLNISLNLNQTNSTPHGAIGLGSWNTSVQYTNLTVTSNGVTLYQSDFVNQGTNGWRVHNGTWSTNAGLYQQTALITDCRSTTGNTNWANYTITLRARKVSGSEGFLILFDWLDDNDWIWWNIGGWGNTLDGIEQMVNGAKSLVGSQVSQTITANVWYDIRIMLNGQHIQCYLNSTLIQDVTNSASGTVVASASYAKSSGQVIVKAVNTSTTPVATTFNLTGLDSVASSGSVIQLTSANATDENSLGTPVYVVPVTNALNNAGTNFLYTLPANSLSILRLQASGIHAITNLQLLISSPLNVGQVVPSSVLAQEAGATGPFDLNTNVITARAISYWAANTTVAVVDGSGNVAGAAPGTTYVVATYNGISATQTVQVVGTPVPPTKLIHRYSFNDGTANDSVGTSNGTFYNASGKASIANNQLFLVGSNGDYVDLGANLITPNTISARAVSLEAWATFYPVNGAWTRLFDFGAINGTVGADYIFLCPNNAANGGNARLAVSDVSPGYNDETRFDVSNLLGQTNAHIVVVFNPSPARQFLGLYLNGSLLNSVATGNKTIASITNNYSFLGRSLYSSDAWLAGSIDEFRIYNGELHADEIAATQQLGPNQVLSTASPVLSVSAAGGNLTLSWPLASAGFTLLATSDLLLRNWTTVSPSPQIVGNQWQVTVPIAGSAQFYRLQK